MKKTVIALASALGLALSGTAFAQDLDFAALDTDGSGGISYEELVVALPELTEDDFAAYDLDGSGELSEDEFAAVVADFDTGAEDAGAEAEAPAE